MMKNYKRIFLELELPEHFELEEIKETIEDTLVVTIKETEQVDGPLWHIAEID